MNILKLLLIFSAYTSFPMDVDMPHSCTGNLFGITDLQKHEILPAKYSRIEHLGHGLFLAWSTGAEDAFEYGQERYLFSSKGVRLQTIVPEGGQLVQVLWLGTQADKDPDVVLDALPEQTLLRFTKSGKFGICKANGEVVLPADYGFIGKASEGEVFITGNRISKPIDEGFYIFNCRKLILTKISYTHNAEMQSFYFSEGLAALKEPQYAAHSLQNELFGYIDDSGTMVIQRQFVEAGPFKNGMASVVLDNPRDRWLRTRQSTEESGADKTHSVVIDKTGKIISPADMEVQQFYGDYAVARSLTGSKYGLVNRQFKYVLLPIYAILSPNLRLDYGYLESPFVTFGTRPSSYSSALDVHGPESVISGTGRLAFTLEQNSWVHSVLVNSLLGCRTRAAETKTNPFHDYFVYFDDRGQLVDYPYEEVVDGHHLWYHVATEKTLLKLVDTDNGRFNSQYWKRQHNVPISRREMFSRFLNDYNLIGMSRREVLRLLGPGTSSDDKDTNGYSYQIEVRGQSCTCLYIAVHLKSNKVASWCFLHAKTPVAPISTNVLLDGPKEPYNAPDSELTRTRPK